MKDDFDDLFGEEENASPDNGSSDSRGHEENSGTTNNSGASSQPFGEYGGQAPAEGEVKSGAPFGEYGGQSEQSGQSGGYYASSFAENANNNKKKFLDKVNIQRNRLLKLSSSPMALALAIVITVYTAFSVVASLLVDPLSIFDLALSILVTVAVWLIWAKSRKGEMSSFGFKCAKVVFYIELIVSMISAFLLAFSSFVLSSVVNSAMFADMGMTLTDEQSAFIQNEVPKLALLALLFLAQGVMCILTFVFAKKTVNATTGLVNGMPFRVKPKIKLAAIFLIVLGAVNFVAQLLMPFLSNTIMEVVSLMLQASEIYEYGEVVSDFSAFSEIISLNATYIITAVINCAVYVVSGVALFFLDKAWSKKKKS